ncbi:BadF/BadG/BcrA/BcrD ATPase family protein [Actinoplanes sp. NPDC051470]|uniref:N-acetylglucosamine kinase n=1 Tax=Actinoplanes sp. NPDC051470 TaxID=3157224 RepID=UPI0034470E06
MNDRTGTFALLDGGKSGLRLRIETPDGRYDGAGAGFTYEPGADDVAMIVAAVRQAHKASGHRGTVDRVCGGLTGATAEQAGRCRLTDALSAVFGGAPVTIVDDGVPAHAGALDGPGVLICAGTGTVAIGVADDGRWSRADGWGPLLGDRGSGYAIGRAGLAAALAATDGTGPPTALAEPAADHLGGMDLPAVQRLMGSAAPTVRISAFAPAVVTAAGRCDLVAGAILAAAADDLARTAAAAGRRCGLSPSSTPVSVAGRLFLAGEALLAPLRRALDHHGLRLVGPRADALTGALRLAQRPAATPYHRVVAGEPPLISAWPTTD